MSHKYVYLFTEGNGGMRELLGGKGANLAEMTNIGLPVPQGFTISTEACTKYYEDGRQINDDIKAEIMSYVDKLEAIIPDGRDYLTELYEIIGLPADDVLSRSLICKWALQSVALLYNNLNHPTSADGVLVFVGGQGIGKTSIVRALGGGSKYCKLGLTVDPRNKDNLISATGAWIVELAELESTLRGDLQMLKAFLTAESDELRRPYERAATKTPRRTSYIGTVNSTDFLIDTTGNRRFWTIPLTAIDLSRLRQFDGWQFWAQIKAEFDKEKSKGNEDVCFRLTQEEQRLLSERNSFHEKALPGEQEVQDVLTTYRNHPLYRTVWTTTSEFMTCYAELKSFNAAKIGRVLDKLGVISERRKVNGVVNRLRELPLPKSVAANWQKADSSER